MGDLMKILRKKPLFRKDCTNLDEVSQGVCWEGYLLKYLQSSPLTSHSSFQHKGFGEVGSYDA